MNPFKLRGFDSLIAAGTSFNGALDIGPNQTVVIDGVLIGAHIMETDPALSTKSTLVVNGQATIAGLVSVKNVTVTGVLSCDELHVQNTLAVKAGGRVQARKIVYQRLHVEHGSMLDGAITFRGQDANAA